MKNIEVAYRNPTIADAIRNAFANDQVVELIDKTPRGNDNADSIDEYLPAPRPMGAGPDQLITLHDFVVAIILNGGYDLIKSTLKKAVIALKPVLTSDAPNGIRVLTGGISSRWARLKRHYFISFSIPYQHETDSATLDMLADDIRRIDKSFKSFLHKNEDQLGDFAYKFEYDGSRWKLKVGSAD